MTHIASYLQISSDPHIWAVQLVVIALLTVSCNFVLLRVLSFFERVTSKTFSVWDTALLQAARLPLRLLVWVVGLSVAITLMHAVEPSGLAALAQTARRVVLIGIGALFCSRLIRFMEHGLTHPSRPGATPVDVSSANAIAKLLRLCVMIAAALAVVETLGVSISGVLAFGGIGGMAIGFAAKDMLSNFFGGLMIYLDKPFSVGDWIRSPDRNIEGTVEDIGWRITRIRTFDARPLYVPNSIFTSIAVENPSRMLNRRIYETLGIRYDDAGKMNAICDDVRQLLAHHPDIDASKTLIVHFVACNTSSLDFMVYCFTKTTAWVPYHAVKQKVMLQIMDIVARHGAQFAYPTQTLLVAATPGQPPLHTDRPTPPEPHNAGLQEPPAQALAAARASSSSNKKDSNP